MTDPELLAQLEQMYLLVKNAFVRYIVENSEAEPRNEFDRKVLRFYQDWSPECELNQAATADLLDQEGVVPAAGSYPIGYTQFNFLSPGYLLRHVLDRSGAELEAMEGLVRELLPWPRGAELGEAILLRQHQFYERARRLELERPEEAPKPPRIKGTSAARW